ncbi:MAG TPA: hypothetical protein VEV45_04250 [Streptosporangiaceae bacterium]|nr:hypothetical protein [Streptosporangiaceae bacterium]
MSDTVARGREARQRATGWQEDALAAGERTGPRRARRGLMAAGLLAVAAGVVVGWRAGAFSSPAPSAGSGPAAPPATAIVRRQDLTATTPVPATLGYAGSYTVTGQGGGTLTGLPQPGQVISQGQVLYQIGNSSPVVLLYGTVPAWRALGEGVSGADVSQLNHNLVTLGDASSAEVAAAGWDYFSGITAAGVQRLEEHAGVPGSSGTLSLGQVVFEPGAIRVAQLTGSLGGPAAGPVLQATSDHHTVAIALDTSQESEVHKGSAVSVTLPDGRSAAGVVSQVGTVATTSTSRGGTTTTTVPVTVTLTDPAAAGSLDQAPVTVYITTATAREVLAVPVTALLARPGGYDVEVAGPRGTRRWVPVTVGPVFDDSSGLVEVSGSLAPGQRVVVASS